MEIEMEPLDQQQANQELEQLGYETLDRLYQAGATESDVKYIAWMAGLCQWKPDAQRRAA